MAVSVGLLSILLGVYVCMSGRLHFFNLLGRLLYISIPCFRLGLFPNSANLDSNKNNSRKQETKEVQCRKRSTM